MSTSLQAQEVTGLAGWSVFLDPGHSQTENQGVFGYSEAQRVVRVAARLQEMLLTETDIDTVYVSRTNDSEVVGLTQRTDMANATGAAWYHSIHSDAGPPSLNSVLMLYGQTFDGREKVPNGGRAMSRIMDDLLARGMQTNTRGAIGDCSFYGTCSASFIGPYLSVNRRSAMPSELSESGFHTNPTQNQLFMNEAWKQLEARLFFWAFLAYHGIERPPVDYLTGVISDLETGLPINGATVRIDGQTFTTDTYASLFHEYSSDPNQLRNGFYYLEGVADDTLRVAADGYRPAATFVAMNDTFFTFQDVSLISNVPPVVTGTTPASDDPEPHPIDEVLVVDFSRSMDRASVEAAFDLSPAVTGVFTWQQSDFRLVFVPDSLEPETAYTLTIQDGAVGVYGDGFDGDRDGAAGGAFSVTFTTGQQDVVAPVIVDTYPTSQAVDVEVRPILSVRFDEALDLSTVSDEQLTVARATGGATRAGTVQAYQVGEAAVVQFFPAENLDPQTLYRLRVQPGIQDVRGNKTNSTASVFFTTGMLAYDVTLIDDFGSDLTTNWWSPQQSGTTAGIVTDATARSLDAEVVNLLGPNASSMRLDYGWDTNLSSGWLIRQYLNAGAPRSVEFDATYLLQMYVFGDGSGNQFRFAVDDRVPAAAAGHHEVSPWYTVDWLGWRLVTWDLRDGQTGTWLGDGTLDGTLRFDSIQLTHVAGQPAFGTLYFDELRLAREVQTDAEQEAVLPSTVTLHPAYPNPFNPVTTLRFEVPKHAPVTLAIFNALGQQVATLVDNRLLAAGIHEVPWDAQALASGVYLARLQAGGVVQTQPLVLLK